MRLLYYVYGQPVKDGPREVVGVLRLEEALVNQAQEEYLSAQRSRTPTSDLRRALTALTDLGVPGITILREGDEEESEDLAEARERFDETGEVR